MRVVSINGSPNKNGNTATALNKACQALEKNGIATERIELGTKAIHGCTGCGKCSETANRRCVFNDDVLNESLDRMFAADGLLIGSPIYYAGINGALKAFLDRAFYVASANGSLFRHKVGAGVVAVRRGGEIAGFDQLTKYFTISEMFMPSSNYWNMVFGTSEGEAAQDIEGMQGMEILGNNMAWLLKSVEAQKASLPPKVAKTPMNFIR
jgi:Multimeric flavodoxin WrbA